MESTPSTKIRPDVRQRFEVLPDMALQHRLHRMRAYAKFRRHGRSGSHWPAEPGIPLVKLEEHLGDGQKTVWFLAQRIRRMMEDDGALLRGVVEADETYLGGKRRKGRKAKRDNDGDQPCPKGAPQGVKGRGGTRKAMVAVAVERKGKGRASKTGTHSELSKIGFRWNRRQAKAEARITDLLLSRHGRLRWRECIA